jgi:hypothetical protein
MMDNPVKAISEAMNSLNVPLPDSTTLRSGVLLELEGSN